MNWFQVLTNKNEPISEHAAEAHNWMTCAVGESYNAAPVFARELFSGAPKDRRLGKLGLDFEKAVKKNRRAAALRIYFDIKKRVARLAGVRVA